MNKEQIQMLRGLIQQEIELGIKVNEGSMWSFESQPMLDKYWEQFAETFNSTTGPLEIDV
jgi:hypothetical protein